MSNTSPLATYLTEAASSGRMPDAGFVAYLASLEQISGTSPEVARAIVAELADQRAEALGDIRESGHTAPPSSPRCSSTRDLISSCASRRAVE